MYLRSGDTPKQGFALLVVALTLVCLLFYLSRPQIDRNYGGLTCGFRWMFWFIPMWCLCLMPAFERVVDSRWGRVAVYAALTISIFSAAYANANPWSHPWIYDFIWYMWH